MTELIWEGKYKDGRRAVPVKIELPFQTIETVNESAQDRQRTLDLFASGRESEWRNRLIWGDKKYVLPSLLPEIAGKVNLIYIDPPFDTGANFSFTAMIPDHPDTDEDDPTTFVKQPSILEQKAYRDTWGQGLDSYLQWFYETVLFLRELLTEDGSLYVHLDWRLAHYAKAVLDEAFGEDCFLNEIIWKRRTNTVKAITKSFSVINDSIFIYTKSANSYCFEIQYGEYPPEYYERFKYKDEHGKYRWNVMATYSEKRLAKLKTEGKVKFSPGAKYPSFKQYLHELKGRPIENIWDDIDMINAMGKERVGFPTQKPKALLERIIKASSNDNDLVLDCFVGSGTTAAAAEKLNRRWIACDLGRFAIHTTRKRLLGIPNVKPFVVQNLGKYERQAWQAGEFEAPENLREREARYRRFILELYHAESVTGYSWLHGAKNGRMVHVGAVDAPVTLADVKAIAAEVWRAVGSGTDAPRTAAVDILGWEFAFELNELARQVAAEARVDVSFKKIPREVLEKKAVEQGDIQFFELGALSVDAKTKGRDVTLILTDFIAPMDDIPEDARKAIRHWSQLVDYWEADWDHKADTFHNEWQSYRTRKDPTLQLEAEHSYEKPGKYTVAVKVIDLLGNDTTTTIEVEIK
jgi:adenine-specific DNA-methyltransferase